MMNNDSEITMSAFIETTNVSAKGQKTLWNQRVKSTKSKLDKLSKLLTQWLAKRTIDNQYSRNPSKREKAQIQTEYKEMADLINMLKDSVGIQSYAIIDNITPVKTVTKETGYNVTLLSSEGVSVCNEIYKKLTTSANTPAVRKRA